MWELNVAAAWLAGLAGAGLLYLAAPKQQALAKHLPRMAAVLGALLLAGAGWLFTQSLSPATAFYSICVLTMLAWSLGPLAVALWRRRRG